MPTVDDDEYHDNAIERLPDLPMYKILNLLPPSSATRCKAVCRRWRSMIFSPSFVRDHAEAARATDPSILFFDGAARFPATVVDRNRTSRLALRPHAAEPREGYDVQNCCGSIACLRNGLGGAELVNPATGDCLHLGGERDPAMRTGADQLPWYCLGRCASTGEYKVMRIDVRLPYPNVTHVTCEVCALGGRGGEGLSRRWKKVGDWSLNLRPSGRGVHIDGVVYYYVVDLFGGHYVVGVDLSTYRPRHMDLPVVHNAVALLSELDGRLCASLVPGGGQSGSGGTNMDLWVLHDDGQGQREWIHRYRFELNGSARHIPRPLFVSGGRRLIMKCADGSLCSYDVGDGIDDDSILLFFQHKSGQQTTCTTADVFVESLLPVLTILQS